MDCTSFTDAGSSDDDDVEGNDGKGYDGNGNNNNNNNNSDGDDDFVELLQIFQDQYRSFMACFNYIYIYIPSRGYEDQNIESHDESRE